MAAQLTVQITLTDNTRKSVSNIISAVIEKDKYIPFSKLTLRAIVTDSMRTAIADAKRIVFYIGGSLVHSGMIDKAQVIAGSTRDELVLVSRGLGVTLCQCEPEPGIWSNVTLKEVVQRSRTTTEITYETGTDSVNYVYIPEKQGGWEAICAYGLKAYGKYPYVRSPAKVCVTPSTTLKVLSSKKIIRHGNTLDTTRMLTKLHMLDTGGQYTYEAEDSTALQYGFRREKFYPLDQQWLQDENLGLSMRLKIAGRAAKGYEICYAGFSGEDLTDRVSFAGIGSLNRQMRVGAIRIEISDRGIFTTLTEYTDGFS
ncbi:MAG: hypothetical protein IJH80_06905 [Ruminococcus sp.]|nr:hypothetical protein [Ruminococcus sp.]